MILYWQPSNIKHNTLCWRSQNGVQHPKFKRYVEICFCTYSLKFFWNMLIRTQFADLSSFFQQFLTVLCKNSLHIIQFTKSLLLKKILKYTFFNFIINLQRCHQHTGNEQDPNQRMQMKSHCFKIENLCLNTQNSFSLSAQSQQIPR